VRHHHLEVNPMAQVKMPKVEKALIRVFTEEELERLDAACDRPVKGVSLTPDERKALAARDRAFLWLLLSTGIRLSEACGLLFSDVDWDRGMIYVRGKGAKERRVPVGRVARQHVRTYVDYWRGAPVDSDEHVFLTAFGTPMRPHVAKAIFARLKRVAGITDKRVSAHTCRHWFAVNCIKNGMPSTALQALLGHEHLEQINTYVRLAEQDTRLLYDRHSPVDSLRMHQSPKNRRQQVREWRKARRKGGRPSNE
jgi:site-specific recombinase XerD